ncbi:presequence protease, mitochondrial-like isoform X2 [Stegodyphus dumicola]|uniref:presequence protease, mitochondrial-like isoform X2 n=1 Tax=Stegodyphus dumicola TaxID=202533 RepID=UPI0015ADB2CE|nr:presequence protease, mitochondrial-like isoform X2 [Stegodyphus dumicola]
MALRFTFLKNFQRNYRRWNHFQRCRYYSSTSPSHDAKYAVGSKILGYSVKEVEKISELNLTAIRLEHDETGADHLHLACDDTNNLFSVALKTIPENSTGVPHILEHLALCGSQKYPCRDPFMNMLNRSLATFMNAFTGSDSTMYVFSSQNGKDFQNLLSVYLDAVFFPCLRERDFRQEGWRLEHEDINDKNSPIIFKGVVFNEMKGVFSDPNQYYVSKLQNSLFPSNTYSYVSGGDPLAIPSLTWKELKQFYAKHYHPSNSRFITYGNLPLESHLENIIINVLQKYEKLNVENEVPDEKVWDKPKEIVVHNRFDPMAAVPEKQTLISNSYLLERVTNTRENFALSILGNLLTDGPNSPFYQSLLESGIGPDYSPGTGYDGSLKQSIFSVGLREIAEKDIGLVKEVIESTFDNVIKNGFPEERIKSVLHNVELSTKHRTSNFGIHCAMAVDSMWNHKGNPVVAFKVNDHVNWFLKQLEENPLFLQDKVVQYFKNNNHKLTLIMSPVDNFEAEQQAKEKQLLESTIANLSDDEKVKIYNDGLELAKHQESNDASCLPSLQIDDVVKIAEETPLKFTSLDSVKVQLCEQPTNEVVYFKALVDIASIAEEDIMLLPLFCSIITQMGAGKRNYKEFDQEVNLKTGGLDVSFHVSDNPSVQDKFDMGILFSSYCLEKNVSDMFSLWKDVFCDVQLKDKERLSQLIKMTAAELAQGIAYRGHIYSMTKANSSLNIASNIKEKASGLSQILYMKKLAELENYDEVLEKLKQLSSMLLQRSTMRCAINATPGALSPAFVNLDSFVNDVPQYPVVSSAKQIESSCQLTDKKIHFVLPFSVNYVGQSILTIPYCHRDFASLKVASELLSRKYLHHQIREKGGAYGGGAKLGKGGQFMFYSYRDPNVSKTLDSFVAGIEWLIQTNHSDQDINEAKLGVFREVDAPVPPGSKGSLFFKEGISHEMKQELRDRVFSCTKGDLVEAAQKYLQNPTLTGTALIGPENHITKSETSDWKVLAE